MENSMLAELAALPDKTTPELKQLWRELYDREPPSHSRAFLIKRLAYRIQELAYGGLSTAPRRRSTSGSTRKKIASKGSGPNAARTGRSPARD